MSSEQIKELLAESTAAPPVEREIDQEETPIHEEPANQEEVSTDKQASKILSAPKPPPEPQQKRQPTGISPVLKTRKDLIAQIQKVCNERGTDPKQYNLKRRRKNSLQGILQEQFAEAVRAEMEPEVHPDLKKVLPDGMGASQQFAVDMAFRLDMTLCKVLEKGIEFTDSYHGLTADGFAEGIQENETLCTEIKGAWLEILSEEENAWILESCTATMRLMLAHVYGLLNVVRPKEKDNRHVTFRPPPAPIPRRPQMPQSVPEAMPPLAPRRTPTQFRNSALFKSASRKKHASEKPDHKGTGQLVKQV